MVTKALDSGFHFEYRMPATSYVTGFRDLIKSFQPNSRNMFTRLAFIRNLSCSDLDGAHVILDEFFAVFSRVLADEGWNFTSPQYFTVHGTIISHSVYTASSNNL